MEGGLGCLAGRDRGGRGCREGSLLHARTAYRKEETGVDRGSIDAPAMVGRGERSKKQARRNGGGKENIL